MSVNLKSAIAIPGKQIIAPKAKTATNFNKFFLMSSSLYGGNVIKDELKFN
jgi:hypothetical protein